MPEHVTATREEWLAARKELLQHEKEHLREGDQLARMRRQLPWVRIDKEYVFETDDGAKTLPDLFDGRSQLLVYHLMFGFGFRVTDETEACTGCSFVADHFDAVVPHLGGRDVTLAVTSIAPLDRLEVYKERMGWKFTWVSAVGNDFHHDFGVAFTDDQQRDGAEYNFSRVDDPGPQREGMSAFALHEGAVYHTYSTYARGVETLMGTYQYLDLAPAGRDEDGLPFLQAWWRRRDEHGMP